MKTPRTTQLTPAYPFRKATLVYKDRIFEAREAHEEIEGVV
jgi:hypothetical protein